MEGSIINTTEIDNQILDDEIEDLIEDKTDKEEEQDDTPPQHATYDITSFGVDFDVAGLVRRLKNEDITIPDWQRDFVWSPKMASTFIESLLLGLPVPGIFMGDDPVTGQLYVVDGQQRLRTLRGFYEGKFPTREQEFKLSGVDSRFEGLAYQDLKDKSRRNLDNSLIHATVVRQDAPANDDTSMYQIFKRLNSGGRLVNPQEIRCAVFQGSLIDAIKELNENAEWREIVGKRSLRLKDQEMILRFMAMMHEGDRYFRPMAEFLNLFTQTNRDPDEAWMRETSQLFEQTVKSFAESKGKAAFRVSGGRAVNAAVFDSMSVGLATRIKDSGTPDVASVRDTHDRLIASEAFLRAVTQGTSDVRSVAKRLQMAKNAFSDA